METKNTLLDEIKAVLKENLTAVIACIKKEVFALVFQDCFIGAYKFRITLSCGY
jgi:hypothetical protein